MSAPSHILDGALRHLQGRYQPPPAAYVLDRAIAAAGGQSALARAIGLSQAAIWHWTRKLKRVPAEHVPAVEKASGIPRHELRPDLYPLDLPSAPPPLSKNLEDAA